MRFAITTAAALALAACSQEAAEPVETETTEISETETAAEGAIVDANSVTAEQLAAFDGMTDELAAEILAGQPYADIVAFNAALMKGLNEEQAATVRESVFVPVNLNTASEEAIKLIPGMTPKMVHEFEEYRPYADMDQFNREIGKYVDEAEVARLRQYVTL